MIENLKVMTRFGFFIGTIIITFAIIAIIEADNFKTSSKSTYDVYAGGIENTQMIEDIWLMYSENILNSSYQILNGKISSTQGVDTIKAAKKQMNDTWLTYLKNSKQESRVILNNQNLINQYILSKDNKMLSTKNMFKVPSYQINIPTR